MPIAIFGRSITDARKKVITDLCTHLRDYNQEVVFYEPFLKSSKALLPEGLNYSSYLDANDPALHKCSCMLTIGGDGTLLEAITHIREKEIPILGINTGRLGFLAGFSKEELQLAAKCATEGDFFIDKRTLVELISEREPFGDFAFALNEVTFHKKESSTMITVNVSMNGEKLNSYWADGLIISTPTGSTGYSLSCGGPILMPESSNLVITPIAPHNLNVRPLVIDDSNELSIESVVRGKNLLLSMDSRSASFPASRTVKIRKAKFHVLLGRKPDQPFLKTLREKLMWGIDKRN
ncbi:MAG: NAD kinase [Bacteroidia bacterium]